MSEQADNFEEHMKKAQQEAQQAMPNAQQTAQQSAERVQEMSDKMLESYKTAGRVALNAYERSMQSMLDFQRSFLDSSIGAQDNVWAKNMSQVFATQLQLIEDLNEAYIKAARQYVQ